MRCFRLPFVGDGVRFIVHFGGSRMDVHPLTRPAVNRYQQSLAEFMTSTPEDILLRITGSKDIVSMSLSASIRAVRSASEVLDESSGVHQVRSRAACDACTRVLQSSCCNMAGLYMLAASEVDV